MVGVCFRPVCIWLCSTGFCFYCALIGVCSTGFVFVLLFVSSCGLQLFGPVRHHASTLRRARRDGQRTDSYYYLARWSVNAHDTTDTRADQGGAHAVRISFVGKGGAPVLARHLSVSFTASCSFFPQSDSHISTWHTGEILSLPASAQCFKS